MTRPIALGPSTPPPSPPKMEWGDNALTAPFTSAKRLPVVDKTKVDPQTLKAAEGFEAMFLDYMMKVMRQTVPKSEMGLDSPATEVYQSMLDSETAQTAARAGGVGLADQIVAYLEAGRYNLGQGPHAPDGQGKAGGTHAGKPDRD